MTTSDKDVDNEFKALTAIMRAFKNNWKKLSPAGKAYLREKLKELLDQ